MGKGKTTNRAEFEMGVGGMNAALQFLVDQSGKSRYRLAKDTAMAESHLSRNYSGEQNTTPTVLEAIAHATGATVQIIVTIPVAQTVE